MIFRPGADGPGGDAAAIKDRLTSYCDVEREIDCLIEMAEKLRSQMEGVGAQQITDMPRSSSASSDRYADKMDRIIRLEDNIRGMITSQGEERKYLDGLVSRLSKSDARDVIRARYFMGSRLTPWKNVAEIVFGANGDFDSKEESYIRRATKLHCQALVDIAKLTGDTEVQ